ncbi:hypothetical protein F7725_020293, partial [Dissostichus mawsoni]
MMTSLFKRSSSNGGSGGSGSGGGGSGSGQGQLNNSRSNRQVRRLEFNQAMEDFKIMFPSMDYEVIECVLRSNNGAVDATIDQLLQMSIDGQGSDDSSDSDDSIPPEILERTLEPDSSDEEPPPVYSPPTYDMHIYDRKYPEAPPNPRRDLKQSHLRVTSRSEATGTGTLLCSEISPMTFCGSYRNKLSEQSMPAFIILSFFPKPMDSPVCFSARRCRDPWRFRFDDGASEQDKKLKQYLEDERIALFLQNEEFMKELQRNREFLMALERDRLKYESKKSKSHHSSSMESCTGEQYSATSMDAVSDDAMFRDKLNHMGKCKSIRQNTTDISLKLAFPFVVADLGYFSPLATRKKLFEIARTFSEKTKRRKSKRKMLLKHHSLGTANSTANLLDDVEANPCGKDCMSSKQ